MCHWIKIPSLIQMYSNISNSTSGFLSIQTTWCETQSVEAAEETSRCPEQHLIFDVCLQVLLCGVCCVTSQYFTESWGQLSEPDLEGWWYNCAGWSFNPQKAVWDKWNYIPVGFVSIAEKTDFTSLSKIIFKNVFTGCMCCEHRHNSNKQQS